MATNAAARCFVSNTTSALPRKPPVMCTTWSSISWTPIVAKTDSASQSAGVNWEEAMFLVHLAIASMEGGPVPSTPAKKSTARILAPYVFDVGNCRRGRVNEAGVVVTVSEINMCSFITSALL